MRVRMPDGPRRSGGSVPLLVAVHGSDGDAIAAQDRFATWADSRRVAVLAPRFADGPDAAPGQRGWKALLGPGERADLQLLALLDAVAGRPGVAVDRVLLAGFSGGAQFVHRFAYLHPDRVRAVSAAAPGRVTLPDGRPWPLGIGDAEARFGREVDTAAVAALPWQVVVGGDDGAAELLAAVAEDAGEAEAGPTRVARARRLAAELRGLGAAVELDVVAGAGHDQDALLPPVLRFLAAQLPAG